MSEQEKQNHLSESIHDIKVPTIFPLELRINELDPPLVFETLDDLMRWSAQEREAWGKVVSQLPPGYQFPPSQQRFIGQLNNINFADTPALKKQLESLIKGEAFISARSPRGKMILRIAARDATAATIALGHFAGANVAQWDPSDTFMLGKVSAVAFQAAGAAYSAIEEIEQTLADARRSGEQVRSTAREAKSFLSDCQHEWDGTRQQIDAYATKAALAAPTEFWKARASKHNTAASRHWFVWNVQLVVTIVLLMLFGALVFAGRLDQLLGASPTTNPLDPGTIAGHVAMFGTLLGLLVWLLRQRLRLALSNQYLAADAEERVTMVETYAALKEKGLAGDDLAPILAALFRSAGTRIVSDDGPVTPMEVLLKQITATASKVSR